MPPVAPRIAGNVVGLPPMAKAPKHVLDAGLMDDIYHELEDNDFATGKQSANKFNKLHQDVTTNASPPRHELLSNASAASKAHDLNSASDKRINPPTPAAAENHSFAPSSNEQTVINPIDTT